MKAVETVQGSKWKPVKKARQDIPFVRSGKVNQWQEEMPREEMVRMMSGADELEALTHELKEFEHGDRMAAEGRSTVIDQQLSDTIGKGEA